MKSVSHMNGKTDADKIEKAINDIGGVCKTSILNVNNLHGATCLLNHLNSHIYYFASPAIRNNIQSYNKELFEEYFSIYVTACISTYGF